MHELASVHQHENGYSVTLRKAKEDKKKGRDYEYDAGTSHVAKDHDEAASLVHAHLKGISDNQAAASPDKADKLGSAARKAYRRLVGVDTKDSKTTESGENADKHDGHKDNDKSGDSYFPN